MNQSDFQKAFNIYQVCPLFIGLKKNELEEIAHVSEMISLDKGQVLFSEGDLARSFFVVVKGRVRVYKLASSGREQTIVTPAPGTSFGEAALFAGQHYPAYCEALENSEIAAIDKTRFLKLIEERPQIALNMIAIMSERLRIFIKKIEQLSLMGVVPRLAEYIAQKSQGKNELNLDISKGDLASLLGTVPETLSRAFAKLKSAGLIEETGARILIKDSRALAEIATSYEWPISPAS